jgi:hypothetical protein
MGAFRGMFKKVKVVEGCMGVGFVVIEEDARMGDCPIASVNIPLASQEKSRALAEFIAESINRDLVSSMPKDNP